jgi:hypothetical protein
MCQGIVESFLQCPGASHDAIQATPGNGTIAHRQQILRSGVHVTDSIIVVEQNDRRRKKIQPPE